GYAAGLAVIWPVGLFWVRRHAPSVALCVQGLRILAVAAVVATFSWGSSALVPTAGPLAQVAVGGLVLLAALGALLALPVVRRDARDVWAAARLVRDRRTVATVPAPVAVAAGDDTGRPGGGGA